MQDEEYYKNVILYRVNVTNTISYGEVTMLIVLICAVRKQGVASSGDRYLYSVVSNIVFDGG